MCSEDDKRSGEIAVSPRIVSRKNRAIMVAGIEARLIAALLIPKTSAEVS